MKKQKTGLALTNPYGDNMNYSAIPAGILLLACGCAHAQTNVTLYGVADIGLKYDNSTSDAGTWSFLSGQRLGSRIGFRGTEALGGGVRLAFTLESGFNLDDGALNNGGRLFGRQAWVGLEGGFGAAYLGRQYSSTYLALKAIDPFKNQEAGDTQRTYGYGVGKLDPISRSDNTVTYTTPTFKGLYARVGYKFGEAAESFHTNSSKFVGLVYESGPVLVHGSYQDTDGVALGAPTTQLGAMVGPTGIGSANAEVKNAFIGGVYNLRFMKLHAGVGDTRLAAIRETRIRNYLAGVTVPVPAGSVIASWNRSNFQDIADGASDQYAIGYAYPMSKRTELYSSASYTSNEQQAALNTFAKGKSEHEFRAGITHSF
jgi:GBP family porin